MGEWTVMQEALCYNLINLTDAASRWTAATHGSAFYAYSTNYLIDFDHAPIVDVEATTAILQAEVLAQRRMIEGTQNRFGLWPEKLVADIAYGSAPNLAWLVDDRGIEPHIPVFERSARQWNLRTIRLLLRPRR